MPEKIIGLDSVGYDLISNAIKEMVNKSQLAIDKGVKIKFAECDDKGGFAFFANSGALISEEHEDILGNVHQVCQYLFTILYRTNTTQEKAKVLVKDFLDSLGRWLGLQKVIYAGKEYEPLDGFPKLNGGMVIKKIELNNPCFQNAAYEGGIQDWIINLTVKYTNDFERKE